MSRLKKIFFPRAYGYTYHGYPARYNQFKIPNRKNSLLEALWIDNSSSTLVILNHPYREEAKDYYIDSGHIELYTSLGCDIIIYDFNGFGRSDDVDMQLWEDTASVALYVKDQLDYNKVILHGISLGASQAINACDRDLGIDTLIVESCLDRNTSYFLKRNIYTYMFLNILEFCAPFMVRRTNFLKEVKNLKCLNKVYFLYGREDKLTTPSMGKDLYNRCPLPCEYHTLKGGHLELLTKDTNRYATILDKIIKES